MPEPAAHSIRVLIVDDIAETRENIRKLLQFETDIEVVGAARSGQEAIQLATESQPDVIIMDINMPDMDGITATREILNRVRYAQIVILSVQSEADYMRRAMLAGARDFIPKPPSGDELIHSIRTLAPEAWNGKKAAAEAATAAAAPAGGAGGKGTGSLHRPEGKIIVLYSAKGGVGCTTLATNLAIGMTTIETPTVLVDANTQFGDVAVFLNLQVKNSIIDLTSRANELDSEITDEVLMAHQSGLKVLAAPPRPEMFEEVHAEEVRSVLDYLRRKYAYVVVDTHCYVDDVTLRVFDASDMIIVVATPDIPAIKDARLVFDLLGVLEIPRERIFFVLNKMDKKAGITAEAVGENLKRPVDSEVPMDERTFTSSINRGVPLIMGDKTKPPAKNVLDLVGAVRQRLVAEPKDEDAEAREPERPRLLRR
jgi:pilus assembly protein CpaE